MKEELKILKDLEEFYVQEFIPKRIKQILEPESQIEELGRFKGMTKAEKCSEELIDINELRQEAIKWCREYLLSLDEDDNPTEKTPIFMSKTTFNWIKHFFNITEEDLK